MVESVHKGFLHLGQCWAEPLEQARTGLAEPGSAAAAGAGTVAKARGLRHCDKGAQTAQINLHGSPFRTTRAVLSQLSRALATLS